MDYSKAKIYKIVNDIDDDIYIGATCQALSKRMAEHRKSMKSKRDSHIKLYKKMNEIGVEHFKILLVEETLPRSSAKMQPTDHMSMACV